jgi:hypothetical protein
MMADDSVIQPHYYSRGTIEVLAFIQDQGLNFALGNVVKYLCRAGYKDSADPIQDLKKALYYLQREVKFRQELRQMHKPIDTQSETTTS